MSSFSLAILLALTAAGTDTGPKRFEFTGIEMAVPVRIVLYAENDAVAKSASAAALARIREVNAVMSDYDPTSEVRRLSATSGSGQSVKPSDNQGIPITYKFEACPQTWAFVGYAALFFLKKPIAMTKLVELYIERLIS